jgi:hypothetical protein
MFHSETLGRAIHADRVRDLERAAREHRLLAASADERFDRPPEVRIQAVASAKRPACGDSAGQPA